MNLSTNKKKIVRTYDGRPLEEGMTVFFVSPIYDRIESYTVKHWHNGINTLSDLPEDKDSDLIRNTIDLRGEGGAGIYVKPDYNPYVFILCSECFAVEVQARKFVKKNAERLSKFYKKIADNALDMGIIKGK